MTAEGTNECGSVVPIAGRKAVKGSMRLRLCRVLVGVPALALFIYWNQPLLQADPDLASIVATAKPAVVFINVLLADGTFASGSGFIIESEGYILTARHVVNGSRRIFVRLPTGDRQEAHLLGEIEDTDSALLKIPGSNYPTIPLGDPSRLRQGDEILVLGYPGGKALGVSEVTVTRGIVSAIRSKGLIIQIDAALNPGNSGGPVVNSQGEVVGIAFAKIPQFPGVNFAVAIFGAAPLYSQIPGRVSVSTGTPFAELQYFPIEKGLERRYSRKSETSYDDPTFRSTFGFDKELHEYDVVRRIVTILREAGGISASEIEDISGSISVTDEAEGRVVHHTQQQPPPGHNGIHFYKITNKGVFEEQDPQGPLQYLTPDMRIPLPLEEGYTWQVQYTSNAPLSGGGHTTETTIETWRVVAVSVPFPVPAGNYNDCANLAASVEFTTTWPPSALLPEGHTERSQSTMQRVYCKDVGLVYEASHGDTYTSETILTSVTTH